MKWKVKAMFQTTNQISISIPRLTKPHRMLQHRFFHRLTHLGPLGPIAGAVHVAALAQGANGAGLATSASPGLA